MPVLALGPIFPYLEAGPWRFGPFTIHMFGLMVGLALLAGTWLMLERARKMGLSEYYMSSMIQWGIVAMLVGAHLFSVIFYFPERILQDPLVLVKLWDGVASTGGFIGMIAVIAWYAWRYRLDVIAYLDAVVWGAIPGLAIGRIGCAFAHDHPGGFTDSWFSVRWPMDDPARAVYPGGNLPGRHDLGLYEFLLLLVLIAIMYATNRKGNRFKGYNVALAFTLYAPMRFGLDFMRVIDERYLGLTPAQWAMIPIFLTGLWVFWKYRNVRYENLDALRRGGIIEKVIVEPAHQDAGIDEDGNAQDAGTSQDGHDDSQEASQDAETSQDPDGTGPESVG